MANVSFRAALQLTRLPLAARRSSKTSPAKRNQQSPENAPGGANPLCTWQLNKFGRHKATSIFLMNKLLSARQAAAGHFEKSRPGAALVSDRLLVFTFFLFCQSQSLWGYLRRFGWVQALDSGSSYGACSGG